MKQRQRGVTLIELLTVMVVMAIIASIAIPSYRRYLLRAQRTDAKTALLQVQTAEEKFLLQNNTYTADVTGAPGAGGLGLHGGIGKGVLYDHGGAHECERSARLHDQRGSSRGQWRPARRHGLRELHFDRVGDARRTQFEQRRQLGRLLEVRLLSLAPCRAKKGVRFIFRDQGERKINLTPFLR